MFGQKGSDNVSFLTDLVSVNPHLRKCQALPFQGTNLTLLKAAWWASGKREVSTWILCGDFVSLRTVVLSPLSSLLSGLGCLKPIVATGLLSAAKLLAFLQQDLCRRLALDILFFRINLETEHSAGFKPRYSIILPQLIKSGFVFCKISKLPVINKENSIISYLEGTRITETQ